MIEYNESLLSRTVLDAEKSYTEALTLAYNRALVALDKTNGIYTKKNLNNIINELSKELYRLNGLFAVEYPPQAVDILEASAKYTEAELVAALRYADIQASLYSIPKAMIKEFSEMGEINYFRVNAKGTRIATPTTQEHLIKSIADTSSSKIRGIILAEGINGTAPSTIATRIRPYVSGNITRKNIRSVTSSLLMESNARASNEFYKENEEYIQYYVYESVLDSRTSILCASLSQKKFKRSELTDYNTPKNHINCRSVLLPIVEGYSYGTRPLVDANGKVHIVRGDMSFDEAQKYGYDLGDKKLINMDTYLSKIKV